MKIVLLNGPPSSGKDTIGDLLFQEMAWNRMKFARPIVDYMQSTFGVSCADGEDKNSPCDALGGLSRREVAILYSERWIKPNFGIYWFGHQAAKRLSQLPDPAPVAVFTDSGFLEEACVMPGLGEPSRILQVRIHRPGFTFADDSRSYWSHPLIPFIDFHNSTSSIESLAEKVHSALVPRICGELEL